MLSLLALLCYALHDGGKRQNCILTSRPFSRMRWSESLAAEVQTSSSHQLLVLSGLEMVDARKCSGTCDVNEA